MAAKIAMFLLACAVSARAAPPVLNIDSGPVVIACTPAGGSASGERLVRIVASDNSSDLYQPTMNTGDWSGHFSRYALPNGAAGVAPRLSWDAGAILTGSTGQPPLPAQRNIYTSIVQPDGQSALTPFTWNTISPAQQALLSAGDNAGEQRLAYLRGDRTLEETQFRKRSSVLGDSVHATPVYVGAVDHREAVYLGANDGMLHAFDAQTGIELFAYVPNALFAQLHYLSDPSYQHRTYVDGPASVGEADINGIRRILISAMGGGAQGVFALDVSDPAHFADGLGALWEFTDRDDPMMGNVTTLPQIARLNVQGIYRDFAIIASGVNNYAADGHTATAGKGALFLLALDKRHDEAWQLNTNYFRLITPISESSLANALSAPVLLNGPDGALRFAYAGDLQGNLWRFDFSGSAPWPDAVGPGANRKPLFVARDAAGKRQPITEQPLLAYASAGGYMVMFGTGQLIESADRNTASAAPQSYYAIIDSLAHPPDLITNRKQLTQRYIDGGGDLLGVSGAPMDVGSKGWYVDFPKTGERSIIKGTLVDGELIFNTIQPGKDACTATHSRSYALSALTGLPDGAVAIAVFPGSEPIAGLMLPDYSPQPVLLQPVSAIIGTAGRVDQKKSYGLALISASGVVQLVATAKTTRRVGRLSWREVANWRELHEATK